VIGEQVVGITKNNHIFPIKVEPACLLKWSWSSVFLNTGTSASCHRTEPYTIDPNNFNNFHNVPEKIRDRTAMLNGQWPGHGCEYCRNVESAGGTSDRQYQLDAQGDVCQHPPELNINPSATEVTPTILEVYFTNTCNMACVYCGPHFSSKWEDENRKFKSNFENSSAFKMQTSPDNPHYTQMVNDLWRYLDEGDRYQILRRFHILGGEPFLLKELDATIDFWDSHGNINLVISIISNLNVPHKRFKQYMKRFERLILERKIWKIQITASLDAWGIEQEYTRYGLELSLWEKNFEFLVDQPWVTPSINSALSGLTIKQMPALIEKINYWNSKRGPLIQNNDNVFGERIHYSVNTTSMKDDLYIFGPDIFRDDLAKVIELMPSVSDTDISTRKQMESIAITSNASVKDDNKIQDLKQYLTLLDHRRNTNWQNTFPWLVDF
jgi:pyruvate-formate lyase-activating enzyme